jgi:hypothetical protein
VSVELDALLVDVLRTRIVAEVEKRMDLNALARQVGWEDGRGVRPALDLFPLDFLRRYRNWLPYFKIQAVSKMPFLRYNKWETLIIDSGSGKA